MLAKQWQRAVKGPSPAAGGLGDPATSTGCKTAAATTPAAAAPVPSRAAGWQQLSCQGRVAAVVLR